jgi:hypothetical protein
MCPPAHPYAYLSGAFCCGNGLEHVVKSEGRYCDGGPIEFDSKCSKDGNFTVCPHKQCSPQQGTFNLILWNIISYHAISYHVMLCHTVYMLFNFSDQLSKFSITTINNNHNNYNYNSYNSYYNYSSYDSYYNHGGCSCCNGCSSGCSSGCGCSCRCRCKCSNNIIQRAMTANHLKVHRNTMHRRS